MNTLQQSPRSGGATVSRMIDFAHASRSLKSILVPIDFSRSSEKAFEYALPLARQFGGEITLLHAIEPPPIQWTSVTSLEAKDSRQRP